MTREDGSPEGDARQAADRRAPVKPTLRARLRPLELLGLSLAFAAFAGLVTLFVMHPWGAFAPEAAQSWLTVLVVFGAGFVLSLVVLAMLALGGYEPPKEPPSNVLDREPEH
ncbi:MAG: hypothetical protein BGO95_02420 [Micrococcales bacterium 73-13]|nr:MAG: hypothetical protein BGO95_02420 [Micrococcales bacterium 73-13]